MSDDFSPKFWDKILKINSIDVDNDQTLKTIKDLINENFINYKILNFDNQKSITNIFRNEKNFNDANVNNVKSLLSLANNKHFWRDFAKSRIKTIVDLANNYSQIDELSLDEIFLLNIFKINPRLCVKNFSKMLDKIRKFKGECYLLYGNINSSGLLCTKDTNEMLRYQFNKKIIIQCKTGLVIGDSKVFIPSFSRFELINTYVNNVLVFTQPNIRKSTFLATENDSKNKELIYEYEEI